MFAGHELRRAQLREDFELLARNVDRTLSCRELLEHLAAWRVHTRLVVLSFDDGPRMTARAIFTTRHCQP